MPCCAVLLEAGQGTRVQPLEHLLAQGAVDHTLYDHTSVLATVEALFGLKPLTQRDANANNLLPLVSATLRTDCPTSLVGPAPESDRPLLSDAERMLLDLRP